MKKILFLIFASICLSAQAQVDKPDRMIVKYQDGTTKVVDIYAAESITFGIANPYEQVVGTWNAATPCLLYAGKNSISSLVSTRLVFDKYKEVSFQYVTETTVTVLGSSASSTVTTNTIEDGRRYEYVIEGNVITFSYLGITAAKMEFSVDDEYLTLTLLEGEAFPPVDVLSTYQTPSPLTYTKKQ